MRAALALTLLCAACRDGDDTVGDPQAPGATGMIALAPGVTTTGYNIVAIRMTPIGNDTERTGDTLLPGEWPIGFSLGGGLGGSHVARWTVRAWLGTGAFETEPAAGAPHAETVIDTGCDLTRYTCNIVYDVMLELAP
jgi:hypothetical protein